MNTLRLLGVVLALLSVSAKVAASSAGPPTAPAAAPTLAGPRMLPAGKIQALIVIGTVEVIDATNAKKALNKGDLFEEGCTILVGSNSGMTMVFSNGVVLRLKENAQLKVNQFQQAPFDAAKEGAFLRLTRDPSQSLTDLDLRQGTLQCEVKSLNVAQGSKFTVTTPVGSFGVRGTIFSITVARDATGKVTQVIGNTMLGVVVFSPAYGLTVPMAGPGPQRSNYEIPAGGQAQIAPTFDAKGAITSIKLSGAALPREMSAQAMTQLFDSINATRAVGGFELPAPAPAEPTQPPNLPVAPPMPFDPPAADPLNNSGPLPPARRRVTPPRRSAAL